MKKNLPVSSLLKKAVLLCMLLTGSHLMAQAQDCGCDFVITPPDDPTTSVFIVGEDLDVKPGQTICLSAGFYRQIRFTRIWGEPGQPITIKNCGGQVVIGDEVNFGRWYAIDMVSGRYIRLTGTGHPDFKYGIKLNKSGDSALKLGLSTSAEIDHLEIANTGFAGILAKTDYRGNPPPDANEMNNLNIHDNYVHDTWGEGMYIGETRSPGENMRHLRVWNNVITRTGLETIQVANAVEDIEVHNNVLYESGVRNLLYQNKNFQIGDNTVGRYYNNFIIGSRSNAMIVMGSGNIEITNNYMAVVGDPAFFIDNRPFTVPGTPINIHNNYIMEVNESFPFFQVFNEINPISISSNNLEGNNVLLAYGSGAGANVTETGNVSGPIERVQFTDVANDDFTLTPGSPYQELGLLADVSGRNQRPYIALIPDHTLDLETTVEVPVSAADPDGDGLVLEAFNLPSFVSFRDEGNGKGTFTIAPQAGDAGVYYKARVRVTDSKGWMNTQYFNITVLDPYAFIATASSSLETHLPENTLDGNLATRWAAAGGTSNWIKYDLREDKLVTAVDISFYNGATTVYPFTIEVSDDDNNWVPVFSGQSTGVSAETESFAFETVSARYLRIVDGGTSLNSYNEVIIHATPAPQVHSFSASDDLYVDGKKIVDNHTLRVKEPKVISYMRFEVTDLNVAKAPVISASLTLTAMESEYASVKIYLGDESEWSESNAGKSNLPQTVRVLDTLIASFSSGQQYALDISSAIRDNGVYNLILVAENTRGGMHFSSSEGAFRPVLSVETQRGAEPAEITIPEDETDVPDESAGRSEKIKLYPNPIVSDKITLDLGSESTFLAVEISDKSGKSYFKKRFDNVGRFVEINLEGEVDMDPGLYFVKVKRKNHPVQTLRILKR